MSETPRFPLDGIDIAKASRSPRSIVQHPDVHRSYLVPVLLKAFNVLHCAQRSASAINVKDIARELGYSQSTVYRIVRTLIACGYLDDGEIARNAGRPSKRVQK